MTKHDRILEMLNGRNEEIEVLTKENRKLKRFIKTQQKLLDNACIEISRLNELNKMFQFVKRYFMEKEKN